VFATYEPLHLDYGQPHPDAVVETTSLSFAELPRITMHSHLPQVRVRVRVRVRSPNPNAGVT